MTEMKTYKHDVPLWVERMEGRDKGAPKPTGPWDDEPDKAQWVDDATGLDCLIVRGPMGALCGYVGVPSTHPMYDIEYGSCATKECEDTWCSHSPIQRLEVHGGLTFSARCHESDKGEAYGICHVPGEGRPTDVWWFGFDCAHAWDIAPGMVWSNRMIGFPDREPDETYRDFAYVTDEVTKLAEQLAAIT